MEYKRLTERRGNLVIDKCGNCENVSNPQGCTEHCCYEIMKNRLAELEDKIEQGTLIELPCKVGDTVYLIATCSDICFTRNWEECRDECPYVDDCVYEDCDVSRADLIIFETKVTGIYSSLGIKGFLVEVEDFLRQYEICEFGKTVFLTREEAEKHLKEQQNG